MWIDIKKMYSFLFQNEKFYIPQDDMVCVEKSYHFLKDFSKDKIIYGINTGFGPMAQYRISDDSLNALQYNIIRSHATGVGEPLAPIYVKASMIARLNTLLQGKSGVHTDLVRLLSEFINQEIYPYVPEHGSVGASGDLVQLAHIALCLIGEGEVFYKGKQHTTASVLAENNLKPLKMYLREGLSITNGTSVMTGIGFVNTIYAWRLLYWSIMGSAMVNEIVSSFDDFMSPELNRAKHHPGQQRVAELLKSICSDSKLLWSRESKMYSKKDSSSYFSHKIQPYYSLRCVPQVLGVVYDTIINTEKILTDEINSVCDNPVIDPDSKNVYHGGNFHGDYVSFEMDKLKIAITKLTMLCERQINYLMHDKINELLPPFVNLATLGLNYGMQAVQFTATSTTAECQTLSSPMYIHSIPCNNDNQDIVSMGTNAALIAKRVIENSYQVNAVLFMTIAQAIDCLKIKDKLSSRSAVIYNEIREIVPVYIEDIPPYKNLEHIIHYLKNRKIERII